MGRHWPDLALLEAAKRALERYRPTFRDGEILAMNQDPVVEQANYAWGDPGTEAGHALDTINTPRTLEGDGAGDVAVFLRIECDESTTNADQNLTRTYKLQRRVDQGAGFGAWGDITAASTFVRVVSNGDIADGAATTDRLSGSAFSFLPGKYDDGDGVFASLTWSSGRSHTELLASLLLIDADLGDGDVLECRIVESSGTLLTGGYLNTPSLAWNTEPAPELEPADVTMASAFQAVTLDTGEVLHVETTTGAAADASTVATGSEIGVGADQKYIAVIGFRTHAGNGAVSSVTGGGLTWTLVDAKLGDRLVSRAEVWEAFGSPAEPFIVTAELDMSRTGLTLSVSRYSGAAETAVGVVTAGTGGVDNDAVSVGVTTAQAGSAIVVGVETRNRTVTTLDTDYASRVAALQGGVLSADMSTQHVADRVSAPVGEDTFSAALNSTSDWCAVGLVLEPAGSGATLVVAGAALASTWESPAMVQGHVLAVDDAAMATSFEEPSLSLAYQLEVDDAALATTFESPALSQGYQLAVDDVAMGSTVEAVALTQAHALSVDDVAAGSSFEAPALTQAHVLAVEDAASGSTLDAVVLSVSVTLAPADASMGSAWESPALTQAYVLTVADAASASTVEAVVLTQAHALTVAGAEMSSTFGAPTLSSGTVLAPDDVVLASTFEALALTQAHVLATDDVVLGSTWDSVGLTQGLVLAVEDAAFASTWDSPALTLSTMLAVQDALMGSGWESPALTQAHILAVLDALLASSWEEPALVQAYVLTPSDVLMSSAWDNLVLPGTVILSPTHIVGSRRTTAVGAKAAPTVIGAKAAPTTVGGRSQNPTG